MLGIGQPTSTEGIFSAGARSRGAAPARFPPPLGAPLPSPSPACLLLQPPLAAARGLPASILPNALLELPHRHQKPDLPHRHQIPLARLHLPVPSPTSRWPPCRPCQWPAVASLYSMHHRLATPWTLLNVSAERLSAAAARPLMSSPWIASILVACQAKGSWSLSCPPWGRAGSMKGFWKYLLLKHLGARWLEGLHYAVFGIGDSGYQKYNFPAKKLDQRLLGLGAERIMEKGLGDNQHPSGYEGALDLWLQSLWTSVNQTNPSLLPRISDTTHPNFNILRDAKVDVIYYSAPQDTKISDSKKLIERARSMFPALKFHIDGEPQYMLHMVTNQRLTKEDSDRDVRHFELEDPCSAISYQVGDALEILPSQNPSAVDAFIKRCNLNPGSYITIRANGGDEVSKGSSLSGLMDCIKLKTFVALTIDVTSASPRRYFFEIMSYFAIADHEKEKLQYFASPEGRDDLYKYNKKERRTVLEVLEDFPSVQMPFEWHTPYERTRQGLCSTWLAGLSPNEVYFPTENLIPCWIHRGSLPPPRPSIPLVLIGPGTGCIC